MTGTYGAHQNYSLIFGGPVCNANVDAYGRTTGTGTIYAAAVPEGAVTMWGPAGTILSYTPVVYKWVKNSTTGAYEWRKVVALAEMKRISSGYSVEMPLETNHAMINEHGYYKVSFLYKWYRSDGVLLKSVNEWSDRLWQQYWYNSATWTIQQEVSYCTF